MERLVDPLTTIDAKLWADEFMKVKARLGEQEFDHAMMLGWFANAIMQGYDEGQRRAKADAQATVEALQAIIKQMGEQAARLAKDGMAAKAQVEALQRELLEWKRALCGLTPGGSEFADDHAYCAEWVRKARENQHDIIISKHRKLKVTQAALDAEREKVKGLEVALKKVAHMPVDGNGQVYYWEGRDLAKAALGQSVSETYTTMHQQLSQLQALVRALPCLDGEIKVKTYHHESERGHEWDEYECGDAEFDNLEAANVYAALLRYRATLDATPPAPQTDEQRFIAACCERPDDCKWGGTGGCGYEGRQPKGGRR